MRFLQITAPISSGSSGGPVFDLNGKVVGITTFQLREGQNLNFAIPIERLSALLQRRDNLSFEAFRSQIHPARRLPPREGFNAVFERGIRLYEADRCPEALIYFLKAQDLRPEEPTTYYNAALCYEQVGDSKQAAAQYYMYLLLIPCNSADRQPVVNWLKLRRYGWPTC